MEIYGYYERIMNFIKSNTLQVHFAERVFAYRVKEFLHSERTDSLFFIDFPTYSYLIFRK